MQMNIFFPPSILLPGFMFPFDGMPRAAQHLAELLPLTRLVHLICGIKLRGADPGMMTGERRALGIFMLVAMAFTVPRSRKQLD
jgi:ABC-2 type transport system permease protein